MSEPQNPSISTTIDSGSIKSQIVNVSELHLNVSQDFIITTEDKIRLALDRHMDRMGQKRSWVTPFGILLTIILTFINSSFKNAGISAATWQAIFIIGGIISAIWLVRAIFLAFQSETVDDVVKQLKEDSHLQKNS
jgi:hypothetical protein